MYFFFFQYFFFFSIYDNSSKVSCVFNFRLFDCFDGLFLLVMLREDKEKDTGKRKVMVNRDAYSICNRTLCRNDNRYLPCVNLQKITYDSLPSGCLLYLLHREPLFTNNLNAC